MKARLVVIGSVAFALAFGQAAWAQEDKPSSPPTASSAEPLPAPDVREGLFTQSIRYTGGDGDNVPEPGERLQVFITLQNIGQEPATDVSGTFKITSGEVTVEDATALWPDIAAGGSEENSTPLVIQISNDAKPAVCNGLPIAEIPPEEGGSGTSSGSTGEGSVSSDGGSVSTDGTVSSDDAVSSDGSQPSDGVIVEPAEPGQTEPVSSGSTEPGVITPEPAVSEPVPFTEPPADSGVEFQGDLTLNASGQTLHADVFNGLACIMSGVADGTNNTTILPAADPNAAAAAETSKTASTSGSSLYLIVVLLAAAGSVVARYRFSA